jgi:hypothetical protein
MPDSVKSGTNPAMMTSAEKRTALCGDDRALAVELSDRGGEHVRTVGRARCGGLRQTAKDVLDQNHGRTDDEPEIDRADGKKVRGLTRNGEDGDGEKKGERNRGRHDDRAAQAAQEEPLHGENEKDAERQVGEHLLCRQSDQLGAIVDLFEMNSGRQDSERLIPSISASTRRIVGVVCSPRRINTMPCTMSLSSSCPAMPRRGA